MPVTYVRGMIKLVFHFPFERTVRILDPRESSDLSES